MSDISEDTLVVGPRGSFRITQSFSCEPQCLIYCTECYKCGQLYMGETSRKLKEHFREHRHNVLNKKQDNEVALHFNQEGHSVEDMEVKGLKFVSETFTHKLQEQRLIGKFAGWWTEY